MEVNNDLQILMKIVVAEIHQVTRVVTVVILVGDMFIFIF